MAVKVLFMEDEPTIREVLAEYMKMQNYEVTCATDGRQALAYIEKQKFDMAVLDIMVPEVDGYQVLSRIRKQSEDTAVIILTALGDEQSQVKAFNLYADDFIIKPVSPIILLKRMETILRRIPPKNLQEGNERKSRLVIEKEAYCAYYDGKQLPLTLSEFLLLETLYLEPNRVFTREQLILRIFNEDYIGNDRIIDAHVKNLRKKLPENFIKTVIGIGYQFCEGGL